MSCRNSKGAAVSSTKFSQARKRRTSGCDNGISSSRPNGPVVRCRHNLPRMIPYKEDLRPLAPNEECRAVRRTCRRAISGRPNDDRDAAAADYWCGCTRRFGSRQTCDGERGPVCVALGPTMCRLMTFGRPLTRCDETDRVVRVTVVTDTMPPRFVEWRIR
jgi:hypothetical protein